MEFYIHIGLSAPCGASHNGHNLWVAFDVYTLSGFGLGEESYLKFGQFYSSIALYLYLVGFLLFLN